MAGEGADILAVRHQRAQAELQRAEAMTQRAVEGGARVVDRRVGGGDDPEGHLADLAAYHLDLALLQRPQELRLQRRRGIADLVEKQRAAGRAFEVAALVPLGTGKGAPAGPEQLRRGELRRDRRHVDTDQRAGAAPAGPVEGAGHQLLAGARGAAEKHVAIARRDAQQLPAQGAQVAAVPQQPREDGRRGLPGLRARREPEQ